MDAGALDAHTCSHGVDAVVIALHGHLGALAGDAGYGADVDKAVVDFGHFELEEAAQEILARARHCDFGVVVFIVDLLDNGAYCLAFAEEVAGDSLVAGEEQLVFLIVEQQGLL